MILGQPKNLEELPPLTANTIRQFAAGMKQQLASGHPLDVPAMMPMGQLMQFARTYEAYLNIVERLTTLGADMEVPGMDQLLEELKQLQADAQALLDTPEPPPPPRIQPAGGPLIIPK